MDFIEIQSFVTRVSVPPEQEPLEPKDEPGECATPTLGQTLDLVGGPTDGVGEADASREAPPQREADQDGAHDVEWHYVRDFKELRRLLIDADDWLQTVPPGERGVSSLYGVTFDLRKDETLPLNKCLIQGFPASGGLFVTYNALFDREQTAEEDRKALEEWLVKAPIVITLREKTREGFVHVEVDDEQEIGQLCFGLLLDPSYFPYALRGRRIIVQVYKGDETQPRVFRDVAMERIACRLTSTASMTFQAKPPECQSCTVTRGHTVARIRTDDDGNLLEDVDLGLEGFAVLRWCD